MSKKEVMQLIFIIKAAYPKYYAKITQEEITNMHTVWSMVMSDYDYGTACAGLQSYISTETEGFPPSPGQIIDHIHKLTTPKENRLSEGEAWSMVYRALCNGIYGAEEEYDNLPPIVQRAVGSPDVIRAWAQEPNLNVTQSNFQRTYREIVERYREEEKLPQSVTALVDKMTERMALTDDTIRKD